jgi:hypothetical protein
MGGGQVVSQGVARWLQRYGDLDPADYQDTQWLSETPMADAEEPYAVIDERAAPLVVVQVQQAPTDTSYAAYHQDLLQTIRRHPRVALRIESGPLRGFPPRLLSTTGTWLREHRGLLAERLVGVAFVLPNAPLRLAVGALFWATPAPFPVTVVSTIREADEWLHRRLEEEGP